MKKFFDDKGGSMDMAGFGTFMSDMGMAMSPEQCESLFKSLDINNDAKLSFEEFQKLVEGAKKA